MKLVAMNVNGMQDERKRREIVERFRERKIDVLAVGETHMKGNGYWMNDNDGSNRLWEGLEGGVCWSGLDVTYKGRGREGCAILMSHRVAYGVTEHGWCGSRIVWVKGKIGMVKYAWVCVYAPVNMKTTKGKSEMRVFWKELNECLKKFESERKVFVMGDLNAKVGCEEVDDIVGKWGVPGVNENGECLVDLCSERGLFLSNTFFEHKLIHRYTWRRLDGNDEQKGLIDYVVVDKRLRNEVMDARVVRGMFPDSDHFAVLTKVRMQVVWRWKEERKEVKVRVAKEKLNEADVREKYKESLRITLNRVSGDIEGVEDVRMLYRVFGDAVRGVTEEVCGVKRIKVNGRKGDAWWTNEVREAVERKRKAYVKWNERNVSAEVKRARRQEYNDSKSELKRIIRESKKKVDDEFGAKLSMKFRENQKLFWKEVKKERGGHTCGGEKVKDKNGRLLKEGNAVRERWREHFKDLADVGNRGKAVITCMGMTDGGGRLKVQGPIKRREVRRAIGRLKMGKAAGVDGITAEMLKFGGEVVIDWMHLICSMAWKQGVVPDDWVKAILVPVYKGKGSRDDCGNYRGISLLSIPGKVYGRIVIERVMEITEGRISEEQGGFRRGRGCVDQIFTVKMLAEKYLVKGRKLYAAFMDLEKAYDRVDWNALWDVLKIYGVGGQLLRGIKAFYQGANACVKIEGELSENFCIKTGVRQGCVMSPWLFNVYMDGVIREMKAKSGGVGAKMLEDGNEWWMITSLFADDTVLFAESEKELQRVVNEFYNVCTRRNLKVNCDKSKVMVFERRKMEVIEFDTQYRIRVENEEGCKVAMGGKCLEEVNEFKYLGTVLCKHGSMEGEIKERAVRGRQVVGSLSRIMRGRNVSVDVKKGLRDSIVLPTLTYGCETWTWNEMHQSRIRAVEMSYLRGACGRTWQDMESNENVYERFGMRSKGEGIKCGVVEWVKRNSLRWFGHVERMRKEDLTKRVYNSEIEGRGVRGRPPVRWMSRVEEYYRERSGRGMNGLQGARRACLDRESWRSFCRGHPLGGSSRRERGVRAIDR